MNINTETVSLEQIYNMIGEAYNKYNILLYIFQGIQQKSNKIRNEKIINSTYVDALKNNITVDTLNELIFNKIVK